jgi:hypothetical protein
MNPIKIVALLRKADATGEDVFRDYLARDFVDGLLAAGVGKANIERIVISNVLENDFRPGTNAAGHRWSGVAEIYVADVATAQALIADADFATALRGRHDTVAAAARLVIDEKLEYDFLDIPDAIKVFGFFHITLPHGRPMSREQCFVGWGSHAAHCEDEGFNQKILKYTQNRAVPGTHDPDPDYDYDGGSIVWFRTMAFAKAIYQDAEVAETTNQSGVDMGTEASGCVYLRTDERQVYARDAARATVPA